MNKTSTILVLFLILWFIIAGIPLFWWIFPIKSTEPLSEGAVAQTFYRLSDQTSYSKEDLLYRKSLNQAQLYVVSMPVGRNPFTPGKSLLNTTTNRLKNQISYHYNTLPLSPEKLQLNGISYTNQGKIALINKQIVKEGEQFEWGKVLKIQENSVAVKKDDNVFYLTLKGDQNS